MTASLMLRKLSSYPRQNSFAIARSAVGKNRVNPVPAVLAAERRPSLLRSSGFNKDEARTASARAVFLGEIRACSFERQRYKASGLTLVTGASPSGTFLYKTSGSRLLAGRVIRRSSTVQIPPPPLDWEHTSFTGDLAER